MGHLAWALSTVSPLPLPLSPLLEVTEVSCPALPADMRGQNGSPEQGWTEQAGGGRSMAAGEAAPLAATFQQLPVLHRRLGSPALAATALGALVSPARWGLQS